MFSYEKRSIGYWHVFPSFSVLSGIKQVNVELEPGFKAVAQRRNNGRYIERRTHITYITIFEMSSQEMC